MSFNDEFYNFVTDGTYFYSSNALRDIVCRINQNGSIEYDFISIDNPISLAITNYTGRNQLLFVQTLINISIYEFDTPNSVVKIRVVPYSSSVKYPSMFHHTLEDKLYISNYNEGTITTIDSNYNSTVVYRDFKGISGMTLASNKIYISNYDRNLILFIDEGVFIPYINVYCPRGIQFYFGNFYICYGQDVRRGIGVNAYLTSSFREVFSDFLFNSVPLNTLLFSNALYITLENTNVIYKNKTIFMAGNFTQSIVYNAPKITQSSVATNPLCVSNTAFRALIQLRTVGSNPSNPIPPITTIIGRTQGNRIPFNVGLGNDYESLKLRRKAETLKYRNSENNPGYTLTTKQLYANMVKYGGAYHFSKARVKQLLKENNGTLPCDIGVNNGNPITITPPTNSGIHDSTIEGYYLNPYITYYPSL